ncbi:MAG: hypothetical protein P8X39_03755 [Desulfofustis sp.]
MFLSIFFALIGCLLTGVQSVLIFIQGEGVCFNDGCRIVDSLTRVDPLYFNLAGFIFFFITAIGLGRARSGSELWLRFTSLLLLAALSAEAVLLAFQILVSEALCSYCLIILSLIVLANVFMGPKQIFKGIVIFSAVLIASFSLDYRGGAVSPQPLENGTMARYQPEGAGKEMYLFISSTCKHCQSVLETVEGSRGCTINFNPVDAHRDFSFEGATLTAQYQPKINLDFLKKLGIQEIPVLLYQEDASMHLIRGEQAIRGFIETECRAPVLPALQDPVQMSSNYLPLPIGEQEGACTIEEDCEDPLEQNPRSVN